MTWTDWPETEGYYWTRDDKNYAPQLVHISASSKRQGCIELWYCPGITRIYVYNASARLYQKVKEPE